MINNDLIYPNVATCIVINSNNQIFVGTGLPNSKLYTSPNHGQDWEEIECDFSEGFYWDNFNIISMSISSTDEIFIGATNSGIFKTVNPTTYANNDKKTPDNTNISVSPNPTSGHISIDLNMVYTKV